MFTVMRNIKVLCLSICKFEWIVLCYVVFCCVVLCCVIRLALK